jgi:hypothetical protein
MKKGLDRQGDRVGPPGRRRTRTVHGCGLPKSRSLGAAPVALAGQRGPAAASHRVIRAYM